MMLPANARLPSCQPIQCLSSYLTTELSKFRNPQGTEENWLNEERGNLLIFGGRVITTEIGAALLLVSSAIESIANTTIFVGSIALLPMTNRPFNYTAKLLQSSLFTCYWNLGNILIFNPFCINIITHESLARYTIEHWPRGEVYKIVLSITWLFLCILSPAPITHHHPYHHITNWNNSGIFGPREEDFIYIAIWQGNRRLTQINHTQINNTLINALYQQGRQTNEHINEGAAFFKAYILGPNQIDKNSKKLVLECDPEIYDFVLTRAVYLYVFGEKSHAYIPSFLKAETKNDLISLRRYYRQNPISANERVELSRIMRNHTIFEENQDHPIINRLKQVAYKEHQNSIFETTCWQRACEEDSSSSQ